MQSNEDTLAQLTSGPQDTSETSMSSLLSAYGQQEQEEEQERRVAMRRRTTFQPPQRTAILDDLSDILQLRGRLQQMGASFGASGELLTYGNPPSPVDFEAMLKLGPIYEEQWATFFVEGYVPNRYSGGDEDGTGQMWSDLRTLKKMLQNEGVVFRHEHKRYSFGDSSTKLRRLCCAYDELRMEWLEMMRTSLPLHDEADLTTIVDDAAVNDSGFIDGSSPPRQGYEDVPFDPVRACIAGRPPILATRSSGVVRNVGWRFSDDLTPPPRTNAWRFSDNLESVPAWKDIQEATPAKINDATKTVQEAPAHFQVKIPIVLHTVMDEDAVPPPPILAKDARKSICPASNSAFGSEIFAATTAAPTLIHPANHVSMLHGPSSVLKATTPSMMLTDTLVMDPRGDNLHVDPRMTTTYIENAVTLTVQEPKPEKTGKKIRRWFKQTFGRK